MNGQHIIQLKRAAERAAAINTEHAMTLSITLSATWITISLSCWSRSGTKIEICDQTPWNSYLESMRPGYVLNSTIDYLVNELSKSKAAVDGEEAESASRPNGSGGDGRYDPSVPLWQRGAGYTDAGSF